MDYLKCLTLTDYQLKLLKNGTREQVSLTAVKTIQAVTVQLFKMCEEDKSPEVRIAINDLTQAISSVSDIRFGTNINEACKNILIESTCKLQGALRMKAFEFYKYNSFDPTPEVIPIMRGVVQEALLRKVI